MALTNKERVGKGLDALKRGLGPYVLRKIKRHYGEELKTVLEDVLYKKQLKRFHQRLQQGGTTEEAFMAAVDPAAVLKIMSKYYPEVFFDDLGHDARNYAYEAIGVRNSYAHDDFTTDFTTQQAARALETLMLLLREVGADQEADEVDTHLQAVRYGDRDERNPDERDRDERGKGDDGSHLSDRGDRDEHAGRYETGRLLGSGGMGKVNLARDKKLHRDVAIKYLDSHYANHPEFVRRFEREAISATSLSHRKALSRTRAA